MSIQKHIPNAITCGNLFCGCMAIVSAFNGDLVWSAYLVGIAAVLDFFDGFVARLLKVGGEMGKQLDSLADMVTFGVVPGMVMYQLLQTATTNKAQALFEIGAYDGMLNYYPYIAFLIPIFSAIRLAKFNLDTRQSTSFIGVPTPANAILICSLPLVLFQLGQHDTPLNVAVIKTISNNYFSLLLLTVLMSFLLVAELPLFALKFKNYGWPDNRLRYSFLIISVLLLILFQFVAIPFIIFLYIILSIISNNFSKPSYRNN